MSDGSEPVNPEAPGARVPQPSALASLEEAHLQSRYTVLQQNLIDLKDRMDREFARFGRMNAFQIRALRINELSELPPLVAESIVDVFEMEFGGLFLFDHQGHLSDPIGFFGIPLQKDVLEPLVRALAQWGRGSPRIKAQLFPQEELDHVAPHAGIGRLAYRLILSPHATLRGVLLAGNSVAGSDFYEAPSEEILEMLGVFSQQVGSILESLKIRAELRAKDEAILRSEMMRRASAIRQQQAEIVSSASVSAAVFEGDVRALASKITEQVARGFGISRVGVWLFEDEGERLVNVDQYNADAGTHTQGMVLLGREHLQTCQDCIKRCAAGAVLLERNERQELEWVRTGMYAEDASVVPGACPAGYGRDAGASEAFRARLDTVIRVGDRALGTVCFEQVGVPRVWTADEISFASQLADQVALTVANGWSRRAEAEARSARALAESANRAKSEFLANMSHELRTPLNAILGLTEALLEQTRGPLNDRQQASLRTVEASGRHLLHLINEILDLARIEAGHLELLREWISARDACEASLALVREQARSKGISLELLPIPPHLELEADLRRLKQILVNLLSNAVKFTPSGGHVSLAAQLVSEGEAIAFTVADTGIGIAREDQARLFKPFVQLDARLERQHEGTGLGLSLVQRLTRMHGGSVSMESEPGRGSRFTVTFPVGTKLLASLSQGAAPAEAAAPMVPASQQPKARLLLAEDNAWNIQTIAGYLEDHGFQMEIAHDGVEALNKAKSFVPDLVIMDIQMPRMDGLEAIRRLRAEPRSSRTPIIALTALAMPGDEARCREAGASAYLSKPVGLRLLIETIESLLSTTPPPAPPRS